MVNDAVALARLKQLLQALATRFQELPPLFAAERERIKTRDVAGMGESAQRIEGVLGAIRELDAQRLAITTQLAASAGLSDDQVGLTELDRALGGRTGLIPLRDRLRQLIQQADRLNQENQAVLRGVAEATEAILEIFRRSTNQGVGYTRQGVQSRGERYTFFSKQL